MNTARKTLSYVMYLDASPEKVFPLLCPVREFEWIKDWQCEMIYTDSGYAEQDCIFKTNFPEDGEDVWVISKYEPPKLIEFIRVDALRVIRYTITLVEIEKGKTESEWKQVITALNQAGNAYVESLSEEEFITDKKSLEGIFNYFLNTGKMKE